MKKCAATSLSQTTVSRRSFLRTSATAAAMAGIPTVIPASALGADDKTAPSNRVTIGCIGVGGQGSSNMRAFLAQAGAQVVAVCDVDAGRCAAAKKIVDEHYGDTGCATYTDFREIIERDDIDAVSIGTPDHWHSVITVAAARAGKDIYCEKPVSLTVADGRAMVDTVKQYGRVLQTGTWRRSREGCRRACELVRNGYIGELQTIHIGVPKGFAIRGGEYGPNTPPQPVPEGFDYDLWLGPAPWAPYTPGRCHFNFRWIMDYSEGYISDWGAHYYDIGQWGNGTDHSGPVAIEATGVFPEEGIYDAPIDHRIEFTYANGVKMISTATEDTSQWGMRFEGSEGWLYVESDAIKAYPEKVAEAAVGPNEIRLYASDNHHGNFLHCIKTRGQTAASIEIGHRSASVCHVGTIALLLGRGLKWYPELERFEGDEEANRVLSRSMRAPWSV
ncbi:MAG: Gfo/Idh/MocA family oxidoreductase [Candidatus Hydrogenedentes bacterium]|nr:Gfo/Idh/MocA family oxidoreductase [Candidatus Hydrogenedentota bacterium]